MRISITQTDAGLWVALQGEAGRFDVALEALKQEIPRRFRKFDPARRRWFIDKDCQAELKRWARRMRFEVGADVIYEEKAGHARSPAGHRLSDAYATLHLLPNAPPELVKAAYRCLAMIHHPDRGGETEAMQRINSAYARLASQMG
jgi:DnaJ-domain-containing protein 1